MNDLSLSNKSNSLIELIDKEIDRFITEDEEVLNFPSSDTPKRQIKTLNHQSI